MKRVGLQRGCQARAALWADTGTLSHLIFPTVASACPLTEISAQA